MEIIFITKLLVVLISIALIRAVKPLQLKKTVYPIYFGFLIITFLSYMFTLMGVTNLLIDFIGSLWIFAGLAFVIIHSSITMGKTKTGLFFSIALIFGLVSEVIGVKYGWIYGHYYYNPMLTPAFFGLVPVINVLSWALIIYISYVFANIILNYGKNRFNPKNGSSLVGFIVLILISMISAMVATNLDMLVDPVVVATHAWFWIAGGAYFGIPISNFVGWFVVVFSVSFLFRVIELIMDKKSLATEETTTHSATIISLYIMFILIYRYTALLIGHPEYLLIGVTAMGPFILITILITYIKFKKEGEKMNELIKSFVMTYRASRSLKYGGYFITILPFLAILYYNGFINSPWSLLYLLPLVPAFAGGFMWNAIDDADKDPKSKNPVTQGLISVKFLYVTIALLYLLSILFLLLIYTSFASLMALLLLLLLAAIYSGFKLRMKESILGPVVASFGFFVLPSILLLAQFNYFSLGTVTLLIGLFVIYFAHEIKHTIIEYDLDLSYDCRTFAVIVGKKMPTLQSTHH